MSVVRSHVKERAYSRTPSWGSCTAWWHAVCKSSCSTPLTPSLTTSIGPVTGNAAAFPVTGPIDVVKEGVSGVLHEDLQTACHQAVQLPQDGVLEYARSFTWERTTDILLETLVSAKSD